MNWRDWARAGRYSPVLFALLFGALYAFQLYVHATRTSATADEPVHMLAGYRHVTCGDYAFNPEHPPLVKQVAAIPLLAIPVKTPALPCAAGFTSKPVTFQLGNRFLVDNDVYRILVPARIAVSVFSLLLAVLLYCASRRMLGGWTPVVALGLLGLEPVMIAHGSLVTTDMAITAATLATALALYRANRVRPWAASACVGLAIGFMLVSKHSALVILPGLLLAFALDSIWPAHGKRSPVGTIPGKLGMLAAAGLISLTMLWAAYEFRYSATPERASTVELRSFLGAVGRPGIGETGSAKVLEVMGLSRLFPESYLMGLADIIGTGKRPSRILGKAYDSGQWFYFPIALSLKTSIPLLLLAPLGIVALYRQRKRRELLYLVVPPGAYLLVCMTSGINIGVRHVLPVYPFLLLLAAAGVQAAWRRQGAWRWSLAILLGYQAITLVRTAPDYLPFANAFWGGSDLGHQVLQDANAEWGQSRKRVADHVQREGIQECWYAGVGAPMLHRADQPCRLLPDGYRWVTVDPLEPPVPTRIKGTIFLSVRLLPPRGGPEYQPLTDTVASGMLAGTLLVYKGEFHLPRVAAISHARRADALVAVGRNDAALSEARRAVSLAPDDPRVRTSLAAVLAMLGRREEATREAQYAEVLVAERPAMFGYVRHRLNAVMAAATSRD